jgi:hypothetical protein
MPLWHIYHPPSTFTTPTSKSSLAASITKIYTSVPLPAFYVNVLCKPLLPYRIPLLTTSTQPVIPVEPSSYYVGGISRPSPPSSTNEPGPDSSKPFIRITIENIARKM